MRKYKVESYNLYFKHLAGLAVSRMKITFETMFFFFIFTLSFHFDYCSLIAVKWDKNNTHAVFRNGFK